MPKSRDWLKQARKSCAKTQRQVAAEAQISQAHYANIERGVMDPSVKAAKAIASALKIKWTFFYR